jgi:putative tricarboxylic transport membrane protein
MIVVSSNGAYKSWGAIMKSAEVTYERVTAVLLFVLAIAYTVSGLKYKLGHLSNPGSGFMPLVVGILLTGCCALYLIRTLKLKPVETKQQDSEAVGWRRNFTPIIISIVVIVYPFFLRQLDFIVSTILAVWVILVLLKYKSVLISGLIAVAVSVCLFFIFASLLNVPLPSGEIEAAILNLV